MPFNATENTEDDDLIEIQESIIQYIADNMGATVNENNFGAVNTNDPKARGFYIVKFTSLPYTLLENIDVDNDLIKEGSLVVNSISYKRKEKHGSLDGKHWWFGPGHTARNKANYLIWCPAYPRSQWVPTGGS
eukprot:13653827-Ditylum_brightwellii.AAC.1